MAKNKVLFGFSRVHYAIYTPGADGAVGTWATPKPIMGAVNFSPEAQGDKSDFYADNGVYFSYAKDNGDSGDLEMALFPEDFLIDILGWEKDKNGVVYEVANKPQSQFALLFEVMGDIEPIRSVYYLCTGSKPKTEYSTSAESVEVKTQTMGITATPLTFPGGRSIVKPRGVTKSANPEAFANFFDAVIIPDFEAQQAG